jgi:23S rRNA pseudouridine2605 synthase
LHKALAAAGVASRRACEALIAAGRVTVNGKRITQPGTRVNPGNDDVRVDGEPILLSTPPKRIYIALHKPIGYVCTVHDRHAQHTILELVKQVEERIYPVGRLDEDSSGLILLTNDGDFAYRVTHPRFHVAKTYRVQAKGFVDREAARALTQGVELADGLTAPAEVSFVDYDPATQTTQMDITIYEGRNRQVRRMMQAVGHPVRSLTRIAFGPIRLGELNPGTWRKLRPEEVTALLALAQPAPHARRKSK